MEIEWTSSAHRDLIRLYEFLLSVNARAAKKVANLLVREAKRLNAHPLLGAQLDEYAPRNVRRLIIGDYELRYEVTEHTIYILRLWHAREERTL